MIIHVIDFVVYENVYTACSQSHETLLIMFIYLTINICRSMKQLLNETKFYSRKMVAY